MVPGRGVAAEVGERPGDVSSEVGEEEAGVRRRPGGAPGVGRGLPGQVRVQLGEGRQVVEGRAGTCRAGVVWDRSLPASDLLRHVGDELRQGEARPGCDGLGGVEVLETVLHVGVVRLLVAQLQPGGAVVGGAGEAGPQRGERAESEEAGRLRREEGGHQAGGVRGLGRGLRHQQLRGGRHLQGSGDGSNTDLLVQEVTEILTESSGEGLLVRGPLQTQRQVLRHVILLNGSH